MAGNEKGTLKRVQPTGFIGTPDRAVLTSACLPQQRPEASHYSNFYMGGGTGGGVCSGPVGNKRGVALSIIDTVTDRGKAGGESWILPNHSTASLELSGPRVRP